MVALSLFAFMIMLLVGGLALDTMRHEMARARLQGTLDSAVLAGASADYADPSKSGEARDRVTDFMDKAGLAEYLDAFEDDDVAVSSVSARVSASANQTLDTHLMRLAGVEQLQASAGAAAVEGTENIEVSLVLDISGSMRFDDRIGDLRPAARQFVTTLLGDGRDATTSISVVPYAGQVNPGPYMFARLGGVRYGTTGGDLFPPSATDISNLVLYFDRDTGDGDPYDYAAKIEGYRDSEDMPALIAADPTSDRAKFDKDDPDDYVYFADAFMRRHDGSLSDDATLVGLSYKAGTTVVGPILMDGNSAPFPAENTGGAAIEAEYQFDTFYAEALPRVSSCLEVDRADFTHSGLPDAGAYDQTGHFMKWEISEAEMDWGWCPEDDTAISYAQNDEAALHDYIDAIRLHDGTGTHYGIKYGLALLDPDSRDAFEEMAQLPTPLVPAEFADRPLDWTAPGSRKFIVLMTDGKVTDQFRPKDIYKPEHMSRHLSNADRKRTTTRSENVSDFYAACDAAKARDIVVYTIAFETDSTGRTEMRDCATSPSHFYAASGTDIEEVFSSIALNITQLRLVQ